MYRFIIICVICFLPYNLFALTVQSSIEEERQKKLPQFSFPEGFLNKQSDMRSLTSLDFENMHKDSNKEELYPNLPLLLDQSMLNERHSSSTQKRKVNGLKQAFDDFDKSKDRRKNERDTKYLELEKEVLKNEKQVDNALSWIVDNQQLQLEKKFVILPQSISRKKYNEVNRGLTTAVYISDYKKLLFKEITRNNINAVRSLIDEIKELDFRDINGNTPLLYAISQGRLNIVRLLIVMGADVTAENLDRKTTYELALEKQRFDILSVLSDVDV